MTPKNIIPAALFAAPLATPAGAGSGVMTRGIGYCTCQHIMATFPDDLMGSNIMTAYAEGFLDGVNGMASADGTLPESGDMADMEPIGDFVRSVRDLCEGQPSASVSQVMTVVLARLKDRAEKRKGVR